MRELALDYYNRRITFIDFRMRMIQAIGSGLTEAWLNGREFLDITRGLSFTERLVVRREIQREIQHLNGLTSSIDQLVAGNIDASVISRRLDLWGDAFIRMNELSKVYSGGDQKLKWVLHPAEHCPDCRALSEQVRTAREWLIAGLYPKAWSLACHQGCKCSLEIAE